MVDEGGAFILWLLAKGPASISEMERESSIPKTTLYRKIRELSDRGWVVGEGGVYRLSERASTLLRMEASLVLGAFHIESLYSKAVKLSLGGWRKSLDRLRECLGEGGFVLTYETAAYLKTGYQTPSAVFAYVEEEKLRSALTCLGSGDGLVADLVLIPVKRLPRFEIVRGYQVVTAERLRLELLTWLGRGVLDLAALGGLIPPVSEEMTDVVTSGSR